MRDIEEHIRRAMEEGKFDNLPGKGKPLRLDQNPLEDPEWRMANHILQSNGFTLPWIETRRVIEEDFEAAYAALSRSWSWRQEALARNQAPAFVEAEWKRAEAVFRDQIAVINKRVFSFNLEVPTDRFQIPLFNADRLVARLTAATLSDTL